jgi:phospholipid/cholesterol/gamma-HCH transport system substrate-binding protein
MAKPFKLRYVNEIAGTFVLAFVLLVLGGVILVGRAQRWFTPVQRITLVLPPEGSLGLERGATVLVMGTSAGTVNDITVRGDGQMVAELRVRQDFMRFVRADSRVVIKRTLGVGDAYIEIGRGTTGVVPNSGSMQAVADQGPSQAMEELTTAIRVEVVPALQELRHSLQEYGKLAEELRNPKGTFQVAIGRVGQVAGDMNGGEGLAGRLLHDRKMADEVEGLLTKLTASAEQTQALIADLRETSGRMPKIADSVEAQIRELSTLTAQTRETLAEAQGVLKDMRATTAQLPGTVKAVDRTVADLPALVMQANETMRQTQRLVEAMQRNWLISPYVGDEAAGRLRPGQAGGR